MVNSAATFAIAGMLVSIQELETDMEIKCCE
jgi:hypothetical protein